MHRNAYKARLARRRKHRREIIKKLKLRLLKHVERPAKIDLGALYHSQAEKLKRRAA